MAYILSQNVWEKRNLTKMFKYNKKIVALVLS